MLPLCRAEGIGVIPWSPLARGFLAGNRQVDKSGETSRAKSDQFAQEMYFVEQDFLIADRVKELATKRAIKPIQIALSWILRQPGITSPIVGARTIEQLDDLVSALDIVLENEVCTYLEEPYQPKRIFGHS